MYNMLEVLSYRRTEMVTTHNQEDLEMHIVGRAESIEVEIKGIGLSDINQSNIAITVYDKRQHGNLYIHISCEELAAMNATVAKLGKFNRIRGMDHKGE